MLKDCLYPNSRKNSDDKKNKKQKKKPLFLYDLSEKTINITTTLLEEYYVKGSRNDFVMAFSGMAATRISEDSAKQILSRIATNTNDEEIESRLTTLRATYQRIEENKPTTGGPTLTDLIAKIKGIEVGEAEHIISQIQTIWVDDIQFQESKEKKLKEQQELKPRMIRINLFNL